jgi:hypothetical protein
MGIGTSHQRTDDDAALRCGIGAFDTGADATPLGYAPTLRSRATSVAKSSAAACSRVMHTHHKACRDHACDNRTLRRDASPRERRRFTASAWLRGMPLQCHRCMPRLQARISVCSQFAGRRAGQRQFGPHSLPIHAEPTIVQTRPSQGRDRAEGKQWQDAL